MGCMDNKVVFITGGSMGMGAADAELFVKEGAKVIIADIEDDAAKGILEKLGDKAAYVHLDVSKEEDWNKAYEFVKENYGHLDVLVNNAGIDGMKMPPTTVVPNIDFKKWDLINRIDLVGPVMGIQAMFPLMKDNGGAIVNIGSAAGLEGGGTGIDYSVAKWGLRGVTKGMAQALGRYNIRCNCLHPGFIRTRLTAGSTAEEEGTFLASVPLNRSGSVDEIASVVLFLASDQSSYVTGIDIPVDGGFTNAGLYYGIMKSQEKDN